MSDAVPVLLRVHNRLDDLHENVGIIRSRWKRAGYPIFVAFNGRAAGFELPQEVIGQATVIELPNNPGHMTGAMEMLVKGLLVIPDEFEYAVTLEADTWVLDDRVVVKYLDLMRRDPCIVWAAGNWVDKYHSLAVDFAIVKLSFIREHHSRIDFSSSIESRLYSLISELGLKSLLISEVNPTHIPKAMPFTVQASGRRRRAFPNGPMVTHHIEDLSGGMDEKMRIANRTVGERIFPTDESVIAIKLARAGYLVYERLLGVIPKSRWVKGRQLKPRD